MDNKHWDLSNYPYEQQTVSNPIEHVVSVADWSRACSTDTHALIRGKDAKPSPLWGDVIFVEHDVHYWLKDVGAVQISDEAWVVLESRPKAQTCTALLCVDFSNALTAKDIYPLVMSLTDSFIRKEYTEVDEYIKKVDINKFSLLAKVSIARSTYAARNKLSNWIELRDKIAKTIDNPEKVLRGLYT